MSEPLDEFGSIGALHAKLLYIWARLRGRVCRERVPETDVFIVYTVHGGRTIVHYIEEMDA